MSRRRSVASQKRAVRPEHPARWIVPAILLGLLLLTWLVFAPALEHGFVNFDDADYIYANPEISRGLSAQGVGWAFTHRVSGNWHPLTVISHMLDCQLFGQKPMGHHFVSVLLHSIAVLLLFIFLQRATGALWPSAIAAAVFAIHPLRAESVVWISERKDVLSGVFFMLTLLAYLRYAQRPSLVRYALVAVVFVCGLMSKSMLVTVPLVLLLLDRWPLRRALPVQKLILEKIPLLALSLGAGLAALATQTRALGASEVSFGMRFGNAMVSAVVYLRQMFWPVRLSPFYPHPLDQLPPSAVVLSIVILAAITLAVILLRRQRPYLVTGWVWYLIMLMPVLGFVQVGLQAHADRYTYLPMIGIALATVWVVADLTRAWPYRQSIVGAAAALMMIALCVRARAQTKIWHDSETLWNHAIAATGDNYFAQGSLGKYLWSQKRVTEAISHFEKSLALRPDDANMHNQVGLGLMQLGRPAAAIAHWKEALAYDPENLNTQSNLAWVFATSPDRAMRDGPRAVAFARNVLAHSGQKTPILLRTLAAAYAETGQFSAAIATTREAVQLAQEQGDRELVAQLESQIRDYELGLPLRDSSLVDSP